MRKGCLYAAILLALAPSAWAQFGLEDESDTSALADNADAFDTAMRAPVIEPIRPIQPFVAPVTDVDPLVEQCDLEPQVAQVYRAAEIVEDDGDCPEFLGRLSANPYASDSTARGMTESCGW